MSSSNILKFSLIFCYVFVYVSYNIIVGVYGYIVEEVGDIFTNSLTFVTKFTPISYVKKLRNLGLWTNIGYIF